MFGRCLDVFESEVELLDFVKAAAAIANDLNSSEMQSINLGVGRVELLADLTSQTGIVEKQSSVAYRCTLTASREWPSIYQRDKLEIRKHSARATADGSLCPAALLARQ